MPKRTAVLGKAGKRNVVLASQYGNRKVDSFGIPLEASMGRQRVFPKYPTPAPWATRADLEGNLLAVLPILHSVTINEGLFHVILHLRLKWYAVIGLGLWHWLVRRRVRRILPEVATVGIVYEVA